MHRYLLFDIVWAAVYLSLSLTSQLANLFVARETLLLTAIVRKDEGYVCLA